MEIGAKLRFKTMSSRTAYMDFDLEDVHLRFVTAHMPHSEYPDREYEAGTDGTPDAEKSESVTRATLP